jgi:hypothetical protein
VSFFDEGDEPTRVRTRPARPRRPATAARRPAGAPPDRQTARTRQAVALALGVLVVLALVLGVNGCLNSRKKNGLKDYNRNVTAVISDSDKSVSAPFFKLLNDGGRSQELGVQVNQLRLSADADAERARNFDVPGAMKAAHRNLELVLNLRAEALKRIADEIPRALGRGQTSTAAIDKITGEMQAFLTSDVVYALRVGPLIAQALDDNGVTGQTISGSRFLPNVKWLSTQVVGASLGRSADGTTGGAVKPGLHGHALVSTAVGTNTLSPEAPGVVNRVPATTPVTFTVKFTNGGDNDETGVKVAISVRGGGKTITASKTVGKTTAKTDTTVSIPLDQTPPVGTATTVTVAIAKVPGEQKLDNNRSTYTVIFTR